MKKKNREALNTVMGLTDQFINIPLMITIHLLKMIATQSWPLVPFTNMV